MARRHNGKEFRSIDHRKNFIKNSPSQYSGDRGHSLQEFEAKQKTSDRLKAEIQRRKERDDKKRTR
jgi:hypothetical protein